jgi:uncharacterized protein YjiS (DUF1127 family)
MSCMEINRATLPNGIREHASLTGRFAQSLHAIWRGYWARRAQKATVLMLQSLDDRTLRDIGIGPGEIESCVYGKARDRRRGYDERWTTGTQAARCWRSVSPR